MNNKRISFFGNKVYPISSINIRKMSQPFITITHFGITNTFSYSHESDSIMLFPTFVLGVFTFFIGSIGIPFNQFKQQSGFGYIIQIINSRYKPFTSKFKQFGGLA